MSKLNERLKQGPAPTYDPAFPYHHKLRNSDKEDPFMEFVSHGLSKRELFAALAMLGMHSGVKASTKTWKQNVAKEAVEMADALLAALEEKK